jgi:hypothetical protein
MDSIVVGKTSPFVFCLLSSELRTRCVGAERVLPTFFCVFVRKVFVPLSGCVGLGYVQRKLTLHVSEVTVSSQ